MYRPRGRTNYNKRHQYQRFTYRGRRRPMAGRRAYTARSVPPPVTSDVMYGQLKYNHNTSDNSVFPVAIPISYQWRGNSCYDPDVFTGLGQTQPLGFDQWMKLYEKCHVLGSKCTVRITNKTGAACQYALYPSKVSSAASGQYKGLREIPYSKTATSGLRGHNGNERIEISNYMSTAKMYCISKQEVKDKEVYGHTDAANPTNQWYWILTTAAFDLSNILYEYTVDVEIIYYVMFKERRVIEDDLTNNPEEE